ncbi:hypothetical protein [Microbacterium sp. 18062]|uniref:hypothetical protein n=1 Tax=Microbacterium sp. 18062 TaxID=2681410 RepID=UPI00135CD4C1|nr:hypothetical protein [Microbacterium sp. 18062]
MTDVPSTVRFVTPRGRLIVLGVLCLLAALLGVVIVLLNGENTVGLLLGVAAIGVFGVGGGTSVINQLRHATVLRADADGIRIAKVGTVPWADVDRIGTTPRGELGLRFRRTDALLANPRSGLDAATLRATRGVSGGYDLTFTARELGTPASDAARALRRRQP